MTTALRTRSLVLILGLAFLLLGCASFGKKMKAFLNGGDSDSASTSRTGNKLKFSDAPNVNPKVGDKQYRRVNKEIFEKEGVLDENSGSLWVMEGQGSYLFSQNLMRISGDVVNINLDGVPRSSLEKKVDIIKTLLERSRKTPRYMAAAAPPAAAPEAAAKPQTVGKNGQPPQPPQPGQEGAQALATPTPEDKADAEEEKRSQFDVQNVPSRIVEKTMDGSYRINGSQSFMIGRKEYRVIATGLVRPADIKNDAIDSSKMVDSHFDIVAIKKETK